MTTRERSVIASSICATLAAIERTGYEGWITVELYPYIEDPDGAAREAREYLTRLMQSLNIPVQ